MIYILEFFTVTNSKIKEKPFRQINSLLKEVGSHRLTDNFNELIIIINAIIE